MTRTYPLLWLACITVPPMVGCSGSNSSGQPDKTLCRKVHERNRKCVDALVSALHLRMGKKVPAKMKQKLAKQLGAEITKSAFLGECRERTKPETESARAARKRLQKCTALPDCRTYAACFLQAMRPPPGSQ